MTGLLLTATLVGLLGGVHCVGMCGGIVAALTAGLGAEQRLDLGRRTLLLLAYNLGRIAGYGLIGLLVGAVGAALLQASGLQAGQRLLYGLAAAVTLSLGLYIGGWWQGLARLERLGAHLWRRIEPLGRQVLPVRHWWQAFAVGLVWAWLPCGLVYSALILALSAGDALKGAAVMLAFGLGTLPNLLGMGLLVGAAARCGSIPWLRKLAGGLVIGFGLYAGWQLVSG